MRIRDILAIMAAYAIFVALSPILLFISLFCEETPEDSYKMQNW